MNREKKSFGLRIVASRAPVFIRLETLRWKRNILVLRCTRKTTHTQKKRHCFTTTTYTWFGSRCDRSFWIIQHFWNFLLWTHARATRAGCNYRFVFTTPGNGVVSFWTETRLLKKAWNVYPMFHFCWVLLYLFLTKCHAALHYHLTSAQQSIIDTFRLYFHAHFSI